MFKFGCECSLNIETQTYQIMTFSQVYPDASGVSKEDVTTANRHSNFSRIMTNTIINNYTVTKPRHWLLFDSDFLALEALKEEVQAMQIVANLKDLYTLKENAKHLSDEAIVRYRQSIISNSGQGIFS